MTSTFALDSGAIKPDAIITDGEEYDPLDPCPSCDSRPHDAPEGVRSDGKAHWGFEHCWKCGFRPGTNTAVSQTQLKRQWEQFQTFVKDQTPNHPTLQPPSPDVIAEMQAQMADLKAQLAQRGPDVAIASNVATGQAEG